jgi:hypothetical protein
MHEQILWSAAVHDAFELVPGDGHRDRRPAELRAQRVRRDGGLVPVVLAPVEEDLAASESLVHPGDDAFRHATRHHLRDGPCERLGRLEADVAVERHVDLESLGAA